MKRHETTTGSAQRYLDALIVAASTAHRAKRASATPTKSAERLQAVWWARRGAWFAAPVVPDQARTAG